MAILFTSVFQQVGRDQWRSKLKFCYGRKKKFAPPLRIFFKLLIRIPMGIVIVKINKPQTHPNTLKKDDKKQ